MGLTESEFNKTLNSGIDELFKARVHESNRTLVIKLLDASVELMRQISSKDQTAAA